MEFLSHREPKIFVIYIAKLGELLILVQIRLGNRLNHSEGVKWKYSVGPRKYFRRLTSHRGY